MGIIVDPDNPQTSNPGGKPPRQDTDITILRDLQRRVRDLENQLSQSSGITFISPNGQVTKTLTIDNNGNTVWT